MSKWILVSALCLACLALLASGALPPQVPAAPPVAADAFTIQPSPFAQHQSVRDLDGAALLQRLRAMLNDVRWLNVTIWQCLHDEAIGFESEARLQLGPEHCARMETHIRTGAFRCETLVVSDGCALAEVFRCAGAPERVSSSYLPERAKGAARDRWLRDKGCSGPAPLVAELRAGVPAWRVDAGLWRQHPVLRLQGTLDPNRLPAAARATLAARSCTLYLDAATLWPLRIEWRTGPEERPARLYLEMEFRDPVLNRALSPEECASAFTYQP